ncbi:SDR family oxidoreductase [Streptomyces sp. NPDC046805]|uniref:SDR family NAD(P)-dependent oxidoreductase n=1 Tax=Streptomyces sp. NPDC046805 TaxID=3155134 RepID=UPI0033FF9CC9
MPHVLVTGAASGIGRAVAEHFAAADHRLTLVDVDAARLTITASALDAAHLVLDLCAADGPATAVADAWRTQGPVDVLVNAAGIYPSLDMAEVTAADWDRVFALNTRAPVLATAELARRATRAGRAASVVNISSGAALRARPGGGPYASSKAALEMATRAAALELGPHGIRVNAVSPGFIGVDSACNPVADEYAAAVSVNPLGRPGTPADVARAVMWIAGPDASWVTGEILRVDGGSGTGATHLPRLWPPAAGSPGGGAGAGAGDSTGAERAPRAPADDHPAHAVPHPRTPGTRPDATKGHTS